MSLTFTARPKYACSCEDRRVGKTSLDRPRGSGLRVLVADRLGHLGLFHRERTHELLEARSHEPLVRWNAGKGEPRYLVAAVTLRQWQSGLRRLPRRDIAPPGGRAARIPGVPRAPAQGEGQAGVRPVHGRAPGTNVHPALIACEPWIARDSVRSSNP